MTTPTYLVQIEFTPGVWTDVTADVEGSINIHYGRTSQFSDVAPATCSVTLANTAGQYTPGNAAGAHYPNVLPGVRIRVYAGVGTATCPRYLGYIRSWSPTEGPRPTVAVSAACRLDRMSRTRMSDLLTLETLSDSPLALWRLSEDAGSTTFADSTAAKQTLSLTTQGPFSSGVSSGLATLGNCITVNSTDSPNSFLSGSVAGTVTAVEAWVRRDSTATQPSEIVMLQDASGAFLQVMMSPDGTIGVNAQDTTPTAVSYADGAWHHLFVVLDLAHTWVNVFVDGVSVVLMMPGYSAGLVNPAVTIGGVVGLPDATGSPIDICRVACYATVPSNTRILYHAQLGAGSARSALSVAAAHYWTLAGYTAGEITIDASDIATSPAATEGASVLDVMRSLATSEGGGSAVWTDPAGITRLTGRKARRPGDPVVTLDAGKDVDARRGYSPTLSIDSVVNDVTVTAAQAATGRAADADSQSAYGIASDALSVLCSDADAVSRLAQYVLAAQRDPSMRLGRVAVDLWTCSDAARASLFALASGTPVKIGDRIRVTALPATQPRSQIDVIIEGWTETISAGEHTVEYDTSPADVPARGLWTSAGRTDVQYGRWQPQAGACSLSATLSASASTVTIASTGPTFTTSASAYPLTVRVDDEDITLTAPPGGSTSPQSFTATRGANGSRAAAHASGAPVALAYQSSWTV